MTDTHTSPLAFRIVDATEALTQRNPKAPRRDIRQAGRLIASLGEAVLGLPIDQQQHLIDHIDEVQRAIQTCLVASMDHGGTSLRRLEQHRGSGLGRRFGEAEGVRNLAAYATSPPLHEWAGPVVGSGELDARYGIARSTLQSWRRSGAVIGLLKGTRKHVFPIAQFVDGRPVHGLAALQKVIGDPRATWLWLVEPRTDDRTALDQLRNGKVEAVLDAARADFAR